MRLLILLFALFLVGAAGADPLPEDRSREFGRVGGYAGGGLAVGSSSGTFRLASIGFTCRCRTAVAMSGSCFSSHNWKIAQNVHSATTASSERRYVVSIRA